MRFLTVWMSEDSPKSLISVKNKFFWDSLEIGDRILCRDDRCKYAEWPIISENGGRPTRFFHFSSIEVVHWWLRQRSQCNRKSLSRKRRRPTMNRRGGSGGGGGRRQLCHKIEMFQLIYQLAASRWSFNRWLLNASELVRFGRIFALNILILID